MTPRPKLLLIDDGDRYIELAHRFLRDYAYATRCDLPGPCWTCERRPGCTLTHAHDGFEADDALRRNPDVEVVLLDVAFEVPVERLLPPRAALDVLPTDDQDAANRAPTATERARQPAAKRVRSVKGGRAGQGAAPLQLERRRRLQGLEILAHLRRARGDLPVILLTSREELPYEDAAAALAVDEFVTLAGADAFDARALGLLIERVLARRRTAPEAGGYLFGRSVAMARLRRDAQTLARTSFPVLMLGETGTGKSALAEQVLHPATGLKGPLVAVDISALPESLLAAELFGTARGAFSGAVDREGRFERAHQGTLFLDEIGNLPLEVQRTLLLALQDGRVTRLGESTPRPVQVKVLAATNVDLLAAVRAGRFRADLYARLNPAARLVLPPLRERLEDLEELLRALCRKTFAQGANRALLCAYFDQARLTGPPQVELVIARTAPAPTRGVQFVMSPALLTALRAHPWPGNVRELEWLCGNAVVFALADALRAAESGRAVTSGARTIPLPAKLVRDLLRSSGFDTSATTTATGGGDSSLILRLAQKSSLREVAQELERQAFTQLYAQTDGDFAAMAQRLLRGAGAANARRVRLRYNQLGLRVRAQRSKS